MRPRSRWLGWLLGQRRAAPRIPDGQCVYAIGDIHGRIDLLDALLERIWADAPDDNNSLIFLGDYVDRGPQSKAVIERLIGLERPDWKIITLSGNHEQLLLEFLTKPSAYLAWRSFGGGETLLSYGVKPPMFSERTDLVEARDSFAKALPPSHAAFLSGLRLGYVAGGYIFVHAGVRPGVPLQRQQSADLLWIRDDFLLSDQRFAKVVVHGHSPAAKPVRRPNRIGIDTGAYATNCLTAVKLWGASCMFLSTEDKQTPRQAGK